VREIESPALDADTLLTTPLAAKADRVNGRLVLPPAERVIVALAG